MQQEGEDGASEPQVIAIVGPTATGKSDLALDLAERLGAAIVNTDAMQLYRGMDIGTAKVPVSARRGIAHYQLDRLEVTDEASVAAYQREARRDVATALATARYVLAVGGSGLYVRALLDEMEFPPTERAVRASLEERAEREGPSALHRELNHLDPVAAAAIHPGNARRIVRALEVIAVTGRPFSASLPRARYVRPTVQLGLRAPHSVLDERIAARVGAMVAAGLVDEVRTLAAAGLRTGRTASRAVGYAQALDLIDGRTTPEEMVAAIALATRQLARRQLKWFGRDERIVWIETSGGDPLEQALAVLRTQGVRSKP